MHDHSVVETTRLNYNDFCDLPDDGKRYEILDGELFMSPSPRTLHQRVLARLANTLINHVKAYELGEVFVAPYDVILSDHDVVEPDIIFVSRKNEGIIKVENIRGVPDLLIEILSPTRPLYDIRDKRHVYERAGVAYYWIVDAEREEITELQHTGGRYVEVCRLSAASHFQPQLFPDLIISLQELWA